MNSEIIQIGESQAILSYGKSDFACPICSCQHTEADWYERYSRSKTGVITLKCKGCKRKLGLTVDITSDVVVWDKNSETK